jgi:hypothetical protein
MRTESCKTCLLFCTDWQAGGCFLPRLTSSSRLASSPVHTSLVVCISLSFPFVWPAVEHTEEGLLRYLHAPERHCAQPLLAFSGHGTSVSRACQGKAHDSLLLAELLEMHKVSAASAALGSAARTLALRV